jgi:hypothetical protein
MNETARLTAVPTGHLRVNRGREYPAVHAYPMTPDPDGLNPDGGPPVATSKSCEGGIQ